MKNNNTPSLRERLMELPTGELDKMLHVELQKQIPDENSVRLILSILEEREKDIPVEMDGQTAVAWEKYQERMRQKPARPKRSSSWIRLTSTLAATVVLALFIFVPQRADALEFIREMLSRWANGGILEVFSTDEALYPEENKFVTSHAGMQLIYDTVVGFGVPAPMIPTEFDDEYEVESCEIVSTPTKNRIHMILERENAEAIFNVDVYSTEVMRGYYGDDDIYELFELDGVTCRITRNYERWVAIWNKDNVEYFLTIDCQEDMLNNILASIYVTEDIK